MKGHAEVGVSFARGWGTFLQGDVGVFQGRQAEWMVGGGIKGTF